MTDRSAPLAHTLRAALPCLLALVVGAALLASCTGTTRTTQAFCDQLAFITGPDGAEVALGAGDPARLDAIVVELTDLLERAPEDISTTIDDLLDFFESYQLAAREDRRSLIVDNEERLAATSAQLDAYALDECGLFLQRAVPTPIATSDPGIEVLPE